MFNNEKFITKGVQEEIPAYLQNLLWYMILIMQVPQKDYLQVFELTDATENGVICQKIIHTQEEPGYKNEEVITVEKTVTAKIYVIDDKTHSTMLLADEY